MQGSTTERVQSVTFSKWSLLAPKYLDEGYSGQQLYTSTAFHFLC